MVGWYNAVENILPCPTDQVRPGQRLQVETKLQTV